METPSLASVVVGSGAATIAVYAAWRSVDAPHARWAAFTAVATWLLSLRRLPGCDPSIVDKLWSIEPPIYAWHLVALNPTGRRIVMATLATLWGARLTYNFAIKGGYGDAEDYRWDEVRRWFPGWRFHAVNLVFVCSFQQTLLAALVAPATLALAPLSLRDCGLVLLFILLLLGETVADAQMYRFQTDKYMRLKRGDPVARGFLDRGLWSLSRHPNYVCEVSMWWVFYLLSSEWAAWTALGPIFLTILFVAPRGSIDLVEMMAKRKYPDYATYQRRVPRFFPTLLP